MQVCRARRRDLLPRTRGRTRFHDLLFRREELYFYAFDVLAIDGEDLAGLPLRKRKQLLRSIMPRTGCRLLHLDWIIGRGDVPAGV